RRAALCRVADPQEVQVTVIVEQASRLLTNAARPRRLCYGYMSEIPYPPLTDYTTGLVARLAHLRRQIATWFWVEGLARVLWLALAIFAADLAIDWLFRMDRPQRGVMLALMLGGLAWGVYRWLVKPLSLSPSDDALALQVESANKQLGQGLITALQLAR